MAVVEDNFPISNFLGMLLQKNQNKTKRGRGRLRGRAMKGEVKENSV